MSGTVTLEPDHTPPRVRIDTTAESVTRTVGTSGATPVRGAVEAGVIYDYECPQGEPVTYLDGDGLDETVEMPDVGVWLIPLASPDAGVRIVLSGMPQWERPSIQASANIPGRANPVVRSWARQSRRGTLSTTALEQEDFDLVSACLDVDGVAFLSVPPRHWTLLPLESWVVPGDVTEQPFGIAVGQPTWVVSFSILPVDRPAWVQATGGRIEDLEGTIASLSGTIADLGS